MNNFTLKQKLVEKSVELGFNKIGFTSVLGLEDKAELFRNWIAHGYNAGMKFFERNPETRVRPTDIVENAKTVIVLAMSYYSYISRRDSDKFQISMFASGTDYHEVIQGRLSMLTDYLLSERKDSLNKYYCDTGSISEKLFAEKAGIGWQGKNSLIITKEFGSYIFLGVIITSEEFEPDTPAEQYCNNCSICMKQCPTQAIVGEKIIDAGKCLAYLTIEHKKDFSEEQKKYIIENKWLFGCDECQKYCPFNYRLPETAIIDFKPKHMDLHIDFDFLQNIDIKEYKQIFEHSAILRRKYDKILEIARLKTL